MATNVERKALLYQQPLQPSFGSCSGQPSFCSRSGNADVMVFNLLNPSSANYCI